ncbi:MAG: HEAT repeat domain-containing protein, partial [Planctomycetota bacterium]
MRLGRILVAIVALACLAAPAMAQATGGTGKAKEKPGFKPKPKKGGVSFEPPEQDPASDPAPEATKPETPPAKPRSDIELLLEQLSSWPSKSAREAMRRALPRYESRKDELLATLKARPIQSARNPRLVAALCHLVAEVGDREQVPNVVAVLRDPIVFSRAAEIIEALVRLDPVHTRENLLPLLSVKSAHVVNEVAKRLGPLLRREDAAALLVLSKDRSAATRRAALGLAAEADFEASKDTLIEALGDKNASVAASAAMTLGFRADDSGLAQLNHLVRGPETRRAAFSVLALVRAGERRGEHVFDDASIAALIGTRGLSSIDPTTRVLGAVALADIGYFEPVPSVDPVLDSEVVPALLGAVAGMQFFSDLTVLKPIALDRLRRLTEGTEDLRSAIDWSNWWDKHGEGFVARRALNSIPGAVRTTLSVTLEGRHMGERRRVTLSARADHAPAEGGAGGRFVALRPDQVDRVAEAIMASKLLDAPEAIGDSLDVPELQITLA